MDDQKEKRVKLTNYEAFLIVEESLGKQKQNNLMSAKNEEMTQKLFEYLDNQPKYSMDSQYVKKLKTVLEVLQLTQFEMMQIINNLPTKPVDIELVVENCGTKLDDKSIDEIIELCEQIRNEQATKAV